MKTENTTRTAEEITADILEYFKENEEVFNNCIEELDSYNGCLGNDRWNDMDTLPELVNTSDSLALLNMAYFGNDLVNWYYDEQHERVYDSFNPNREYFRFNGYGNLEGTNWKDYRDYMNEYAVKAMSENRAYIDTINDNEDLSAIFDELDEAE